MGSREWLDRGWNIEGPRGDKKAHYLVDLCLLYLLYPSTGSGAAFGDKPIVSSLDSTQPIAVGRRKFKEICKKLRE